MPDMRRFPFLQCIMIVMLTVAVCHIRMYGYYVLLRFVICGGCGYLAIRAHMRHAIGLTWCLGVLAVIYNPFMKLALGRGLWTIVNIATIAALAYSVRRLKDARETADNVDEEGLNGAE